MCLASKSNSCAWLASPIPCPPSVDCCSITHIGKMDNQNNKNTGRLMAQHQSTTVGASACLKGGLLTGSTDARGVAASEARG